MANDIERILTLPVDEATGAEYVDKWTERLRVPGGEWTLRPAQALALEYIENGYGGWFPITVGGGKTLIAFATAVAAGIPVDDVLVLAPASLRDEAESVWEETTEHFDVPLPEYYSYSMLSSEKGIEYLDQRRPKIIVCDEGHMLANTSSARGNRFFRHVREHSPRLVMMSGTFTARTIEEYRKLTLITLRRGAPVPDKYTIARALDRVIGVGNTDAPSSTDFAIVSDFADWSDLDEDADLTTRIRTGYKRRMAVTPGVVLTEGSSCDAPISLDIIEDLELPDEVDDACQDAESIWELPEGEEILDELRVDAKVKQLTQGFYYRFVWPDGEPNREWLHDRRDFYSRVRAYADRAGPGRDTPTLVIRALEKGEIHFDEWDTWSAKWLDYEPPPTEAVWISDYLLRDAVDRADDRTIIWYKHRAVGEKLSEFVPTAMAGQPVPDAPVVALSLDSHGTGLNLQRDFKKNIVLYPPSNAGLWQQFLGRTHRLGFAFDQVHVSVYAHHWRLRRAFEKALDGARYLHETQGVEHKLLLANGEIHGNHG